MVISSLRTGHCFELSVIVDLVNKEEIPHLPSVGPDLSEARKLIIFLLINFLHCFFTPLPAVQGLLSVLVTRLVIISDYQVSFLLNFMNIIIIIITIYGCCDYRQKARGGG